MASGYGTEKQRVCINKQSKASLQNYKRSIDKTPRQ